MKTAKKIGMVSGGLLSVAQNVEASLARQEAKDMEMSIPDGHPLRKAADNQKALMGDLSGLPAGHPLLVAMQKAKERYIQQQEQRTVEQDHTAEIRKTRKIEADETRREVRRLEDEQSESQRIADKKVNSIIESTLVEVRKLYRTITENEEILNIDPLSRTKVGRLKRLLFAAERGLSECRISRARA